MGHERQPRHAEFRVFISSTFRDLHEEREQLVKKIFPEIRVLCRERGIEFTEIDLRWGLTEEEGMLGRIVRTCLEEIDRCRPYFIGILGDRYGYVPSLTDIYKDPVLLGSYSWVEEASMQGMSIIEMECRYGALGIERSDSGSEVRPDGAFFYLRSASSEETIPADEEGKRLRELKEVIRTSGLQARSFQTPEELGSQVHHDLVNIIERDFSRPLPTTQLERERQLHEAFALSRRNAYIPNTNYIHLLDKNARSGETPLVIYAPSGAGKSSLVSYWVDRYRRAHPDELVIEHYAGLETQGEEHSGIIRHIMLEIKDHLESNEELPTGVEEPGRALRAWLSKVGKNRCVIAIDGLDSLHGDARALAWLPRYFASNIRLVVTVAAEELRDALQSRGWPVVELAPLIPSEQEAMIVRFLGNYHKALTPLQVRRIAQSDNCSQPLFLRTLLEELRVFGSHEQLDQQIDHFLELPNVDALFQRVLERLEADYGETVLRNVMGLLWATMSGLTERELQILTDIPSLQLTMLLSALDFHLLDIEGRYHFSHDYLRSAVGRRYCSEAESVRAVHRQLAHYFARLFQESVVAPLDSVELRVARELLGQLAKGEEIEHLRFFLSNLGLLIQFSDEGLKHELLRYWIVAGGVELMEEMYDRALEQVMLDTTQRARVYRILGMFLGQSGRYGRARTLLLDALAIYRNEGASPRSQLSSTLAALAEVLYSIEEYHGAEELFREALALGNEESGPEQLLLTCLNSLGVLLWRNKRYSEAVEVFRKALAMSEQFYGAEDPRTAMCMNNLAVIYQSEGDIAGADGLLQQALAIRRRSLGPDDPFTASTMHNLAYLRYKQGDVAEAKKLYHMALSINEQALGRYHPNVAECMKNLAAVYESEENFDKAEQLYRNALSIWDHVYGAEHSMSATGRFRLGRLLLERRNFDEAEILLRKAFEIFSAEELPDRRNETLRVLGELDRRRGDGV